MRLKYYTGLSNEYNTIIGELIKGHINHSDSCTLSLFSEDIDNPLFYFSSIDDDEDYIVTRSKIIKSYNEFIKTHEHLLDCIREKGDDIEVYYYLNTVILEVHV